MELSIPYADLTAVIRKKTGKEVSFECVDEKTIRAGYDIPVPIIGSKRISLNIIVDRIIGSDVYLRFGSAAALVIRGLISHFKSQTVVGEAPDGSVIVHLDRIEKAQEVLEAVALEDIAFYDGEAKVKVGVVK